jgi:hypothetical protein
MRRLCKVHHDPLPLSHYPRARVSAEPVAQVSTLWRAPLALSDKIPATSSGGRSRSPLRRPWCHFVTSSTSDGRPQTFLLMLQATNVLVCSVLQYSARTVRLERIDSTK